MRKTVFLPPAALRARVGNSENEREYLCQGSRITSSVRQVLASCRFDLPSFTKILDFGCGCGRVLNFLRYEVPAHDLFGCDVDLDLVRWCSTNLDIGGVILSRPLPPLGWGDKTFDLILAISILTHLPEDVQLAWLCEWHRILKPDGVLVVSVHGSHLAGQDGVTLPKAGFLHLERPGKFNDQVTFQTQSYVRREWSELYEIIDFQKSGLLGHQDLIVLEPVGNPRRRRQKVGRPDLPPELVREYRLRPDLKKTFDRSGRGRKGSTWKNLTLLDWALFNGGYGETVSESLSHLAFDAMWQIVHTD